MDKAPDAFRTISEVADELDLPQHVLRFWETRFSQIKPMKRGGGRRYYRPDDVDLLRGIRHLLYGEGYTIRGVQRLLKDHGVRFVQTVWQAGAPQPAPAPGDLDEPEGGPPEAASLEGGPPEAGPLEGGPPENRPEPGGGERGRKLFALVPPLLASNDDGAPGRAVAARREPPLADDSPVPATPTASEGNRERPSTPAQAEAVRPPGKLAVAQSQAGTAASGDGSIALEDVGKLRATLVELTECRRLLDEVLGEPDPG